MSDKNVTPKSDTSKPSEKVSKVPDDMTGFEPVSLHGPQSWMICDAGNFVRGILMGRMKSKQPGLNGEARFFYQIRTTVDGTRVTRKVNRDDEKATEFVTKKGEVVCFDEKAALSDLADLTVNGGKYEVYIAVVGREKHPTKKGATLWVFDVKKKTLKQPTRVERATPVDDSDIPF